MITEKYLKLYQQMHADGYFAGDYTNAKLWGMFEKFFIESESRTLLDFGSGKGLYWKNYPWHSNPELTCYDPAYEPFSKLPESRFDMIMSKDCLEHIPLEQLEECIQWFYKHANKTVVHFICETLATKNLPNGENAHCTVMTVSQYAELFQKYAVPGIETILFTSPREIVRF
jgi:hypothetical protein